MDRGRSEHVVNDIKYFWNIEKIDLAQLHVSTGSFVKTSLR